MMDGFSKKEYLSLTMPTNETPVSDQRRIELALEVLGYSPVVFPLSVLRKLYPLCREADFNITVSLCHRENDWVVTQIEAGDTTGYHYGLAVDYGSTTIVMQLVDMISGAVIGQESVVNGQVQYGTDILTRITYVLEDKKRWKDLQLATVQTFHQLFELLTDATGIDAAKCPAMVISGNTTMIHFLLGLDAWTVFADPFAPVTVDPGFFCGTELGMDFEGQVYIVPAASNYVGGDIVSGLLVTDIHNKDEVNLFFDIGTNGELVLGCREWLVAGAGAAGPALEGYISKYGMRAAPGAIDHVKIEDGKLSFTTIGSERPVGICGSGIIDLLAYMRRSGWINMAGQLEPSASDRIEMIDGEYVAVYATGEESALGVPLYFSQTDIDQYLDTKAAAFTMVDCILEIAGITEADISKLYLSGAFPAYSDLESAITIGMFPDLQREKFELLKNSSLQGARIILSDHSKLMEAKALSERIYCVQFASVPDFLVRMQAAKFIPHTDKNRFPSVQLYFS